MVDALATNSALNVGKSTLALNALILTAIKHLQIF